MRPIGASLKCMNQRARAKRCGLHKSQRDLPRKAGTEGLINDVAYDIIAK